MSEESHRKPRRGSQPGGSRAHTGQRNASRTQRPRQRSRISGARIVAYDVLRDVVDRDAYANLALASRIRDARLDARDAALATELAAGTLRGMGRIDRIIELAAGRPATEIDSRTLNVLRLGAHQLLSMRTATHAAVNESVELQRLVGNERAAGFVNGVLREITRSTSEEWDRKIEAASKNRDDAIAARTSHPAWIVRALRDALRAEGREDELETLLAADNISPRVHLALLPGAGIWPDELAASHGDLFTDVGVSSIGLELTGGDPGRAISEAERDAEIPEGMLRVQDQGSQLAALALARVRPAAVGERWLDLCAGPGGKTAILGAEAQLAGATVRANELSQHRARLVEDAVRAVSDAVEIVSFDGRDDEAYGRDADGANGFHRILVDAPCSGLGALRRRPEARWRKQPGDLPALTQLQLELLETALDHLAPGGVLAYVTCSPHLAETRVTVERFMKLHPEVRELDAKSVVRSLARAPESLDLGGDALSVQLWPHRHGTDAMFIALFERAGVSAGV